MLIAYTNTNRLQSSHCGRPSRRDQKNKGISFEVIGFDFALAKVRAKCASTFVLRDARVRLCRLLAIYISGIPDLPQPLTFISSYTRHHNLHYNYFSVLFLRRIMIPPARHEVDTIIVFFLRMHANKEAFYQSH